MVNLSEKIILRVNLPSCYKASPRHQRLLILPKPCLKTLWEDRSQHRHKEIFAIKKEKTTVERKINQLVERIMNTDSTTLIETYEQKVQQLEQDKMILEEKITNCGKKLPSFNDHVRTSLEFLSNPHKLWDSGVLEHQRNVLRLCFGERLSFDKNSGFRTPSKPLPIRVLEGLHNPDSCMGRGDLNRSP